MPWQKKLRIDPVHGRIFFWISSKKFYLITSWTNENQCEPMRTDVNRREPKWTNENQQEPTRTDKNRCEQTWKNENQCEPPWTDENRCEPMRSDVNWWTDNKFNLNRFKSIFFSAMLSLFLKLTYDYTRVSTSTLLFPRIFAQKHHLGWVNNRGVTFKYLDMSGSAAVAWGTLKMQQKVNVIQNLYIHISTPFHYHYI